MIEDQSPLNIIICIESIFDTKGLICGWGIRQTTLYAHIVVSVPYLGSFSFFLTLGIEYFKKERECGPNSNTSDQAEEKKNKR